MTASFGLFLCFFSDTCFFIQCLVLFLGLLSLESGHVSSVASTTDRIPLTVFVEPVIAGPRWFGTVARLWVSGSSGQEQLDLVSLDKRNLGGRTAPVVTERDRGPHPSRNQKVRVRAHPNWLHRSSVLKRKSGCVMTWGETRRVCRMSSFFSRREEPLTNPVTPSWRSSSRSSISVRPRFQPLPLRLLGCELSCLKKRTSCRSCRGRSLRQRLPNGSWPRQMLLISHWTIFCQVSCRRCTLTTSSQCKHRGIPSLSSDRLHSVFGVCKAALS